MKIPLLLLPFWEHWGLTLCLTTVMHTGRRIAVTSDELQTGAPFVPDQAAEAQPDHLSQG